MNVSRKLSKRKFLGLAMALEIMLGLGLFALAALFVMRLFPAADEAVTQSARVVQATQEARKLLEAELASAYGPALPPRTGQVEVPYGQRRGAVQILTYSYRIDETQVNPHLKRVLVTVIWTTGTGTSAVNRSVQLETQKAAIL